MAFIKPTGLAVASKEHLLPLGRQIDQRLYQVGLGQYSVNPVPGVVLVHGPQTRDARGRFTSSQNSLYALESMDDRIRSMRPANEDAPTQPDIFSGPNPKMVVKKRTSKTRRPKGK
jgi:hypothetical protein